MSKLLRTLFACGLAIFAAIGHAAPATLYDNTTGDQQQSVFFSTGFTRIGDQLQLTGPGQLGSLSTQFYNAGDDARFNATATFYTVGANPVQIGGSFSLLDLFIGSGSSLTVNFNNLAGLVVPSDLIVALSIELVDGLGDIGLNLFDAPSTGASDNRSFIADDGAGLALATTLLDIDNLYLRVAGPAVVEVPEPGTLALVLLPLAVAVQAGSRRLRRRERPAGV